jgi:hypothetical protein
VIRVAKKTMMAVIEILIALSKWFDFILIVVHPRFLGIFKEISDKILDFPLEGYNNNTNFSIN